MLYYRVKPQFDNKPRYKFIGHSNLNAKIDGIFVAGELYTPRERERLMRHNKCFDIVEISRKKIFWCFGARFADEETEAAGL